MRNLLLILIVGILTIGIIGCGQGHQTDWSEFEWLETDPLAFLEFLKKHQEVPIMTCRISDWIKEEHIGQLMKLIDSQKPCAPVFYTIIASSDIFNLEPLGNEKPSTVGKEAMLLIERFRGKYPRLIGYEGMVYAQNFNPDPDEYRKWWSERKKRNIRK